MIKDVTPIPHNGCRPPEKDVVFDFLNIGGATINGKIYRCRLQTLQT